VGEEKLARLERLPASGRILEPEAFDLILSAQAFHWIEANRR